MKKILTFFVMLLMTGSMLMAQNDNLLPKLNYQAVLRDADNHLVAGKSGNVNFLLDGVSIYQTTFETNQNGLAQVVISTDENVRWTGKNSLKAVFNVDGEDIEVVTPITTVPFALQATNARITTEGIVNYVKGANGYDVNDLYQALKLKSDVHDAIRDSVVNYIKNHFDLAKDIAFDYLTKVEGKDVDSAYAHALRCDQDVKDTVYSLVKRFLKGHRELMLQVAEDFISSATTQEAEQVLSALKESGASEWLLNKFYTYFDHYLRTQGLLCSNQTLCDYAAQVRSSLVCPTITSAVGVKNDGVYHYVIQVDNPAQVNLENTTVKLYIRYTTQSVETETDITANYNTTTNQYEATFDPDNIDGFVMGDGFSVIKKIGNCGCDNPENPDCVYPGAYQD